MTRLKSVVSNHTVKAASNDSPYLALEHIEPWTGALLPDADFTPPDSGDGVAHLAGDVRFGKLRPYLAKSVLATEPGVGSSELLTLRPDPVVLDRRYFWYLTLSEDFVAWAEATSYGVKMPRTNWRWLGDFDVVLPTLDEQRATVAALDQEIAGIDVLLDEQRRLRSLVVERRASELDRVITGDLGNPAMKASDIPFLAAVPEAWEVAPLKHCVELITVGIVITPSKYYEEAGVPVLRGLNVRPGVVDQDDLVFMSDESNALHSKSVLRQGDVVVVRTGAAGAAAEVPDWAVGGNIVDLLLIRPDGRMRSRYLELLINSRLVQEQVSIGAVGALQAHFNTTALANVKAVMPPLPEQDRIVAHLDHHLGRYDKLVAEVDVAMRALLEHRRALITAATTGPYFSFPEFT